MSGRSAPSKNRVYDMIGCTVSGSICTQKAPPAFPAAAGGEPFAGRSLDSVRGGQTITGGGLFAWFPPFLCPCVSLIAGDAVNGVNRALESSSADWARARG